MTRIKICGLKTIEDIQAVNRWKPDFAGFVFAPGKRQITLEQAAELRRALDSKIQAVGVFVNAPLEEATALADAGVIQLIQLHGEEDAVYMENLRRRTDKPLIKAVAARSREEILEAENLPCEYLLLDAYRKGSPGGNGETFDWKIIPPLEKPWFLAGGLSPENWSGRQQRGGDTGEKISTEDQRIYRKSERIRIWEKEDMEFLEDSIYRKP